MNSSNTQQDTANWKTLVAKYQKPSVPRATWQIVNSIGSYIALWVVMYFTVSISWWITIPLAILAGGFLVRVFIIFHDCGHGSFFKSKRANSFWGYITGFLTLTPYHHWRWEHSVHHASTGHLDRRGIGDIWTMTVDEYLESSRWKRVFYRLVRNPIVLFVISPLWVFVIYHRFTLSQASVRAKTSVWVMNAALLAMAFGMSAIYGFLPWLIIQLTITAVSGSVGIWLFYVQHQFEDAYWERGEEWDFFDAAMKGSSFYKLPKILQWFSGNIGYHHIHHLSSRIPNYNLERCHNSDEIFQSVEPLYLGESFKTMTYRLWDESTKKLITFGQLKKQLKMTELESSKAIQAS